MNFLNATQTRLAFLPRFIVALVLMLAFVSGIASLGFASAVHPCTMECCAGLSPHAAGSCHMNMSPFGKIGGGTAPGTESTKLSGFPKADNGAIKGVAAGVMGMKESGDSSQDLDGVTIDATEHCNMNSQSEDSTASSRSDSLRPTIIAAQSFSKPCPPECSTGAISSGVRPSRDAATLGHNARPRSPTLVRKYKYFNGSFLIASICCKKARPRGPPLCFS